MRKRIPIFFSLVCIGGLVLCSKACADAARDAVELCLETVIPSLFPFFVLSSLLVDYGAGELLGRLARNVMRPLFGIGRNGAAALALGLLGGYPVGARTVGSLYRRGELQRGEAEQLLAFCNNCGPGFILGFCGGALFHSARVGVYLYLVHAASALLTGILLRRKGIAARHGAASLQPAPEHFPSAFSKAVSSALRSIASVCGCVVLFMVLWRLIASLPLIRALPLLTLSLLAGAVELTGGIAAMPCSPIGFIGCAVLLGWGGLSVHAQSLAALDGTGLSVRRYFLGKAVQATLSVPLAMLACARLF